MCTTMLTQYCGNMKRHQIAFVSLIDFVVSIHAYQCMHLRQKHANLRNNLPGGMHGFRWATHWWGSSCHSPNHCTVHFHVKKDAYLDVFCHNKWLQDLEMYCVCGAYSTRRKDASFFIGSVYSQSRRLMSNLTLMTFNFCRGDMLGARLFQNHLLIWLSKTIVTSEEIPQSLQFWGFMRFQRFSSKVSRSFFGNTSGKSILDTNFAAEGLVESVGWLRRMLFPLLMAESYSIETSFKLFLICWIFVEKTISYYDICCFFWWIDCYRKCCEKLHLSGQWGACDAAWKEMGLGEPRLQQWQVERNTWTTEEIENKHSNNDVCCRYIYIRIYIYVDIWYVHNYIISG